MAKEGAVLPLQIAKVLGDWSDREASGTIKLSFYQGKIKSFTKAEVEHVTLSKGSTCGPKKRSGKI